MAAWRPAGRRSRRLIGGASVRLTVFVLSLLNVAAFAATGLLLHWMARGDRARQLRAALLWTANPLLLQVLIAGAHVDSQAIVCDGRRAGGLLARYRAGPRGRQPDRTGQCGRELSAAAGAGALIGLGFAVKATRRWSERAWPSAACSPGEPGRGPDRGSGWRRPVLVLGGLAAGFGVTAGASLAYWGTRALEPALREGSYVSIGSPWRAVRAALGLATGAGPAEDAVKAAAVVLALVLLVAAAPVDQRGRARMPGLGPAGWPMAGPPPAPGPAAAARDGGDRAGRAAGPEPARAPAVIGSFAVVFAWLVAWPYVLPWYDGLGWALLALLPCSRLDWLMLARTAALAVGYLPGRTVVMPADLGWLRTVVRGGITPVILLAVTVALVVMLRPRRGAPVPARYRHPGWSRRGRGP